MKKRKTFRYDNKTIEILESKNERSKIPKQDIIAVGIWIAAALDPASFQKCLDKIGKGEPLTKSDIKFKGDLKCTKG